MTEFFTADRRGSPGHRVTFVFADGARLVVSIAGSVRCVCRGDEGGDCLELRDADGERLASGAFAWSLRRGPRA